jgi:hypothetical protein
VAVKAKRKWNPSLHPRDARGRFTRSATRVMQPADRKRAAAGQQGFAPAELGDAGARSEWLQRESAATPPPSGRIAEYLNGGWRTDNPAMRSGKPVDGLAELDAAFVPLGEDVMLRRVVPSAMFAHIPISDLVGMKVRDAAPASSSLDHTGPGHPGAVTMHIAAPAGTRAYVNDEAGEVLLMRDTEVAITRAVPRPDGNGWDLYGALIPRKDAPARQPRRAGDPGEQTPAADGRTPAAGPDDTPEGDETTAGGVGTGAGGEDGGGGEVTPDAAPVSDSPIVLWRDAETGRPVYNPGQPEIVRGQVVRDPEREERVRRGMALAAAAMAGEPEPAARGGDRDQDDQGGEQRAAAAPADSTAGGVEDGAAGGAPAEAEPVKPTRASWRDHDKPATALYYGRGKNPTAEGRRVKITQRGMGIGITDAETDESIDGLGITAKIWLAPDPDATPAGDRDQQDQDAPATADAPDTPAAGTRAPSDQQDAPAGDDQPAEAEDNGPLVAGAPRDVIAAAVGRQRFNDLRGQGLADLADGLTPDEKRAVWDAMTGDPLDHDRITTAIGAARYNGIYQAVIMPSTRDQDRESVLRAALARELTADEKAALEATPETAPANPRDLSGAPEGSLAASVALGIRERRALGGGNSGATVELVTLEDGRQAVRKRAANGARMIYPHAPVSPKDQQDAEELGAAVAEAFGLRVPEMVRVDDDTSFFELLPGVSGMELLIDADDKNGLLRQWADSDDGKRMGLADLVMGNPDRNAGNFMPDGEQLPVLDHSLAFDYGTDGAGAPWIDKIGRDWFQEHYVQRAGSGIHAWRDNPLTPADAAEARTRLAALAPKFAELGREDWHAAATTRLDLIAAKASGDRNLIAPAGDTAGERTEAPDATTAGTSAPADMTPADFDVLASILADNNGTTSRPLDEPKIARLIDRGLLDDQGRVTARGKQTAAGRRYSGLRGAGIRAAIDAYSPPDGEPAEDVTPATTAAASTPDRTPAPTGEAGLPKTQAKALAILRQLGDGEHTEYEWRNAGAGIAAIQQLERKGYVTRERRPFVMPKGPYAGETFQEWHYTLAPAEDQAAVRRDMDALAAAPIAAYDPAAPITTEQRDALAAYQDGAGFASFQAVNGLLRGQTVGDRPDTQRVVDGIDGVMAASRLTGPVEVWRGVRRLGALPADRRGAGDLTGATWREDAYLSTTPVADHAAPFAGSGRTPIVMRLTVPAGVGAVNMMDPDDQGEIELLIDRGHEIRVTADHGVVNGRRRLDAEVLPKAAADDQDTAGDAPEVPAEAETPATGGPRIPAPDGERINPREDPAGWAAAQTDAELERTAGTRGVLPRIKRAIAEEQRIRALSPEDLAAEQRLDPAVSNPTRGKWADHGLTSGDRILFFGTKTREPKARGEVATVTLSGGRNPHILVRGEGDESSLLLRLDAGTDRFWAAPVDASATPASDDQGDADTPAAPDVPAAGAPETPAAGTDVPAAAEAPAEPGSDRQLGELAMASIQTHSDDDFAALPAGAEIARGDLVVVRSFNRWRTGVVTNVSANGRVEALVATPSSPDRVYGARGRGDAEVRLLSKGENPADLPPAEAGTPVEDLDTTAPDVSPAGADQGTAAPAAAEQPATPAPAAPEAPLDADRDLARRAQTASGLSRTVGLPRRSARMDDPQYKADYNRGWKASHSGAASIDRGDERNEWSPWYDGWSDYSIGVPKWSTPREDDANDRGLFAGEPLYRVTAYRVDPDTGERTESGRPESFFGRERLAMYLRDYARTEVRAEDFNGDDGGAITSPDGRAAYEWTATPQDQLDSRPRTEEDLIRDYQAASVPAGDQDAPAAGTSAPETPAAPAGGGELAGLPAGDQARIRIAVADHAAKLARNPMLDGNPDDVARYLAEGELTKVTDQHGLRTVWAAVAQALAEDPDAMTRSQADIDANAEARRAEAARLSSAAAAATRAGEFDNALQLIDAGEQADPDFTTDRGRGWSSLRDLVASRRDAATAAAPADGPAPIVAGSVNDAPLTPNNWGGLSTGPVHYHPDGEIGRAVAMLGADARLDVDGLPLAEWLNRLATRGARVEITAQDQVAQLRELEARLPDGTAKRVVRMAAEDLDAPASPAPDVPEGTPEPLARLMGELWAVPMVRRDGTDAPEIAGLNKAIARANRGTVNGARLADMIRGDVLNKRHESKEGKTEIDAAVRRAMSDLEAMPRPAPAAAAAEPPFAAGAPVEVLVRTEAGATPKQEWTRARVTSVTAAGDGWDVSVQFPAGGYRTKRVAADGTSDALRPADGPNAADQRYRLVRTGRDGAETVTDVTGLDALRAELETFGVSGQLGRREEGNTSGSGDRLSWRPLADDETPAAGTGAPDADQPATAAPAAPAAAVVDDDADPFAAMLTRVPKSVSRAETADGTAPGVYETDMFGNVTAFVPGRREAIGVAARADVGRERSIAAAQQLGLLDETEMRGGGLGGAEVALFGLFDMPPADPPAAAAAPAPDATEDDQRTTLARRVLAEDLDGWTDEQLSGAFADLSSGDELTGDQEAALQRIGDLWDAREARMRAVVAGIPEDLTTLDDDEAVALLVALTSTPGAMDQAAVDRVNADLDRREAEATEGARNTTELMERAYGDTSGFTTEAEFNARHEAAVALGDWDQVDNNLAAWTRWEEAEAARAAIAQQEADRREAERIEALRIEQEAAAAVRAAELAEAERVRTERQMIAARAAAVIPPTEDSAVRSAHQTLGEDETRRVIGAEKYDAIAAAAANGPLQDPAAVVYGIRAALLGLPEDDKARLVMAAAEMDTPADIREMDEISLLMEVMIIDTPDGDETPEQAEARRERARFLKAEQRRRGMLQLVAEGREQFATYRSRVVAGPVAELSDKELAAAPAIFADDPDVLVTARLGEVRAEADRRQREADERAAAKAAGPTAPARLLNPVAALGAAERMLENYGRDFQYARDGQARLLSARALTVGLPADATEAEIKKAERGDDRSHYERAGWTIAWYRHLGQFAEMTDRERQLDWLTGPDDDPDVPEIVMPLPGAKVPKPVEAWEAMKNQAIYDRKAGINDGAIRYTMALARSYGIPFDPADRDEASVRRLGSANQDAMRHDPRTAAQQAASFIAEWRRLAAEDGVDPDNHLLYGPPDRRPKNVPRTQWTPTADEAIRVDRLVAGGMDYDQAYGEVMGIDPDDMRRAQAAMAVTGVMRPSDKLLRDHYAEFVYRQSLAAEDATNGYLLNKAGKAAKIDPDSLFSGDPDRAYRYASEELLRFWGTPGNERKTFSEYKAELVGDTTVARRKRATSSKGNQFA